MSLLNDRFVCIFTCSFTISLWLYECSVYRWMIVHSHLNWLSLTGLLLVDQLYKIDQIVISNVNMDVPLYMPDNAG